MLGRACHIIRVDTGFCVAINSTRRPRQLTVEKWKRLALPKRVALAVGLDGCAAGTVLRPGNIPQSVVLLVRSRTFESLPDSAAALHADRRAFATG